MSEYLFARQVISDQDLKVYGYEILVDELEQESDLSVDGQLNLLAAALETKYILQLSDHKPYFVGIHAALLLSEAFVSLPKTNIFYIIDFNKLNTKKINALVSLSLKGYQFVLDHFLYDRRHMMLLYSVKMVIIDSHAPDQSVAQSVMEVKRAKVPSICGQVDSYKIYNKRKKNQFDYYKGGFFTTPDFSADANDSSNRVIVFKLLQELDSNDIAVSRLEKLLAQDSRLSYQLLKLLNSPTYGLKQKIDSINQAIVLVGMKKLRSWLLFVALTNVDEKPLELMVTSMMRAKMCEIVAIKLKHKSPDQAFMTGLLSTLDAILDKEISEILKEINVNEEVADALLERQGVLGQVLNDVINYEAGHWGDIGETGLTSLSIKIVYMKCLIWTGEIFSELKKNA